MDNRCPNCQTDLSRRLLKSPIRGSAVFACPGCAVGLAYNVHPKEGAVYGLAGDATVALGTFLALIIGLAFSPWALGLSAFVTAMLIGIVALVIQQLHFYRVVLVSWPRYSAIKI